MKDQHETQPARSPSTLHSLRELMPARVLSLAEGLQRAEAQANRLLALHDLTSCPVPSELVSEQPRLRVEYSYDLPASGSAFWEGSAWIITLNAGEYERRQRFSLFHEYKHILDHPTRHLIAADGALTADEVAERLADYFAACVLMPKAWVKAAFFSRSQSVERLAALFGVSCRAMSVRLTQLGLLSPTGRRPLPVTDMGRSTAQRRRPRYFRRLSKRPANEHGVLV